MNNLLRKSFILTMVVAMVLTMFAAFSIAEDASASSGELVVTGYTVTSANGAAVSRITKGSKVNVTMHLKHTQTTASDIGYNPEGLQISRRVDSFSGGDNPAVSNISGGLLEFDLTVSNLTYKGTGNSLKLMVGYNGLAGAQDNIEIPITECKEYEEPAYEPAEPQQPDPLPAPKAIISRNDLTSSIKPDEEITVTVYVKNIGSTTMQSPVIQFTPSDSLMLPGSSSMVQLNSIAPGKTESVAIKVRALGTISGANQYIDASLSFDYHNRVSLTSGTAEGKIIIPAKVKKTEEPDENAVDSPVPNIIITRFDYGGSSVAAGAGFNLSFKFKNTSSKLKVENLVATVEGGEGLTLNGSSNTFYFEKIGEGSEKTVSVPMKASRTVTGSAQPVSVSFKYEYVDNGKRTPVTTEQKITVPVYQPDRFEISKPALPVMVYAGEETSLSLNYVNKSKSDISNVEAEITGNIESVTPFQNIGNLEPGKSGTIVFAVTALEPGEAEFTIKVTYEDGNGDTKTREFPVVLSVEAMDYPDPGMDEPMPEPEEEGGINWPLVIGIVIAIAAIAFAIIKKKKKAAAARKEAEMWDKWDDDMDDSGEEPNAGEEKK
ncbi:MAG: COG1361 S-layer family protein [Anaerovoracaceae bacterium]